MHPFALVILFVNLSAAPIEDVPPNGMHAADSVLLFGSQQACEAARKPIKIVMHIKHPGFFEFSKCLKVRFGNAVPTD